MLLPTYWTYDERSILENQIYLRTNAEMRLLGVSTWYTQSQTIAPTLNGGLYGSTS
jgi:hypothetical protein